MKEWSLAFWNRLICIVHLVSESSHDTIEVHEKKFVIGRKLDHLIAINDTSISRDHIQVVVDKENITVEDMGSSNGTTINGKPIIAFTATPYQEGTPIQLGKCPLNLYIEIPRGK